jgi:hypothetical protein
LRFALRLNALTLNTSFKGANMPFTAAHVVALCAMLFAGSCALTFAYIVGHLDPPADPASLRPVDDALSVRAEVHGKVA